MQLAAFKLQLAQLCALCLLQLLLLALLLPKGRCTCCCELGLLLHTPYCHNSLLPSWSIQTRRPAQQATSCCYDKVHPSHGTHRLSLLQPKIRSCQTLVVVQVCKTAPLHVSAPRAQICQAEHWEAPCLTTMHSMHSVNRTHTRKHTHASTR